MARPFLPLTLVLAALLWQCTHQQIVPADIPSGRYCAVSTEEIRNFPTVPGFYRSSLDPLTSTKFTAPAPAPVPLAEELSDCTFQSFDRAFDTLVGSNRTIYRVGPDAAPQMWASESPIFFPDTNELIVAAYAHMDNNTIWRVNMGTGEHIQILPDPPIGNAGGVALYQGEVAFATSGDIHDDAYPPGIYKVNPETGNSSVVVNNFFGQRFNGLDDLLTLKDGTIIFTDANYTTSVPYINPTRFPCNVWIVPLTGPPRALITGLPNTPNGLAVTADEKTLYIGVGPLTYWDPIVENLVNQVFAFDLQKINGGYFATNQRTFAINDRIYIDGIRVDMQGNVYGASGDGVSVWAPSGSLIGKIILPPLCPIAAHPVTSLAFVNNNLIMLRVCEILMLPLNTTVRGSTDVAHA